MDIDTIACVLRDAIGDHLITELAQKAADYCGFICASDPLCGEYGIHIPRRCDECKRPICHKGAHGITCVRCEGLFCTPCGSDTSNVRSLCTVQRRKKRCGHMHSDRFICAGCADPCPECTDGEFYYRCGMYGRNRRCHFCNRILCAAHRGAPSEFACGRLCYRGMCHVAAGEITSRCACGQKNCTCSFHCNRCGERYCVTCKDNGLHECGAKAKALGKRTRQ